MSARRNYAFAIVFAVASWAGTARAENCDMLKMKVVAKTYQAPGTPAPSGVTYELSSPAGSVSVVELQSEARPAINSILDLALVNELSVNLVVKESSYSKKACAQIRSGQAVVDTGARYFPPVNDGTLYFPTSDILKARVSK